MDSPAASGEVRFYDFHEVDRTAEPDSDWNLDTGTLDLAGVQKLVFEIFVNPTGEVVGCTILEPVNLSSETRALLQTRLSQTTLSPATLDGVAVASVRRIELAVE